MSLESIPQLLRHVVQTHGDKIGYRYKRDGRWLEISWREFGPLVDRVSKGLVALGVQHGDRVSILSQTRFEWVQCDLGIVSCGAVTVGVYHSSLGSGCAYILNHCRAGVLFVENRDQLEKILAVRDELPGLQRIVICDGDSDPAAGVVAWDEFLRAGDGVADADLEARKQAVRSDDLASLVYTSGTTGVPKGAMISHGNLLFSLDSANQAIYSEPHFETLMFLPLAHVFARLIVYCCLARPITTTFAEDFTKVPENLRQIRPHWIVSVPRVYEKAYDKIVSTAEAAGGLKRRLFNWAIAVGLRASRLRQSGRPVPAILRVQCALADRLVFQKVRAGFGGRLRFGISGAAPLNVAIAEFFDACGVLILEGIGMTENTSFTNVNRIDNNRFGTVGQAGPGVEIKIAEDGEVLFRGGNVMQGYYRNPEATAEAIDDDGWLHSGDIGELDEDGFLKITDRKKDLIITAGGKNVAPQRIERIMRASRFIGQVMAHGDRRKYISALVTLDADNIRAWASENGLAEAGAEQLAANPKVRELIAGEIEKLNAQLASFETIKGFHILPRDFSIEEEELTPTLKLKRKVITERYRAELDSLYG